MVVIDVLMEKMSVHGLLTTRLPNVPSPLRSAGLLLSESDSDSEVDHIGASSPDSDPELKRGAAMGEDSVPDDLDGEWLPPAMRVTMTSNI